MVKAIIPNLWKGGNTMETPTTDGVVLIGIFGFAIAIFITALICFVKITISPRDEEEEEWDDEDEDLNPLQISERSEK